MAKKANVSKDVKVKRTNAQLEAENEALKSKLKKSPESRNAFSHGWKRLAIILCVGLATAILVVANVLFWVGNTLVNTDRYVATTQALLKDSTVQSGIADYTTNQIFDNNDVSGTIQEVLPPRADFLAATLVPQLKNATNQALQKILASDKFQTVWVNANRTAHDKLINAIKNSKTTDGKINIQDVYNKLSQNLSGTKLGFLAGKSLPTKVGSVQVIDAPWIPTARNIINKIDWLKPVALVLIALFSALALWLTRNRRKMTIMLGLFFGISMFLLLVSLRVARNVIASNANPAYQPAVDQAVHIIFNPLVVQVTTVMLAGLLMSTIAWISGPYKRATSMRQRINDFFAGHVHESLFGKHESKFTAWFGNHKRLLQWTSVAVIAIIMLMVKLSPSLVLLYGLLMILCFVIIEVIAQPVKKSK